MRVPTQVVDLRLGALWTNAKATHERDRFISNLEHVFVNLRRLSFGVPPWTPLHVQLQRVTHLTLEIPRDYTFSANEAGCAFTCPVLTHFAMENVSDVSFVTDTLFNVLSTCAVRSIAMSTNGDIAPRIATGLSYPTVEELSLRLLPQPWTSRVMTKMPRLLKPFPRLRYLEIVDDSHQTVRGSLVDMMGHLPHSLERIRLVGLQETRHMGLADWAFPQLQSLEFIACHIGRVLQSFAAPALVSVCLHGSLINSDTVQQLLASSSKPHLRHLDLSESNITALPAGMGEHCPALERIALDGCQMGRALCQSVVQEAQHVPRIVVSKGVHLPARLARLKSIKLV